VSSAEQTCLPCSLAISSSPWRPRTQHHSP
jgi:hypothetical protein